MFGFFIGSLCLFGLFGMARAAMWRHHHAYAWGGGPGFGPGYGPGCGGHGFRGGWRGGWGGRGRRGPASMGGEGFARAAGEVFKRRLRIDEEQDDIVDHALIDLRKAVKELVDEVKDTRAGIADAFRGETVDEAALAAAFARHDDAVARARREVVSSLKQVHAVLDADQRKQAADLLASGEGRWV